MSEPASDNVLPADISAESNGEGTKSTKISLTVPQSAFVEGKSKIPFNWNGSSGYLNRFERKDGQVVCSGAVIASDAATREQLKQIGTGSSYEASIDFAGKSASLTVSGRSKEKNKGTKMEEQNNTESKNEVQADTKAETVETPAEVKTVEAVVEVVKEPPVQVAAEVKPVEAANAIVKPSEPAVVTPKVEEIKTDPRAEFKRFASEFGDRAGDYFAKGLTFEDAVQQDRKTLKAENADLQKRLAAVDRGAAQPLKLKDTTEVKPKIRLEEMISFAGKKKTGK